VGAEWEEQNNDDGSSTAVLHVAGKLRGRPPDRIWKSLAGDRFSGIASYYRSMVHILKLKEKGDLP
jgi:hypothetical protein